MAKMWLTTASFLIIAILETIAHGDDAETAKSLLSDSSQTVFQVGEPRKSSTTETCPSNETTTVVKTKGNAIADEWMMSEDGKCITVTKTSTSEVTTNKTTTLTQPRKVITKISVVTTTTTEIISVTEPTKSQLHCLFAGDLLNYGKDNDAYMKEAYFIGDVAKILYENTLDFTAGLWVYGYTRESKVMKVTNETMRKSYPDFLNVLYSKMKPEFIVTPGKNSRAISLPRNAVNRDHHANCLVFLTGADNVNVFENATLKASPVFETVVAVSLKSIPARDLSKIVTPPERAVSVSKEFSNEDAWKVIKGVLE